MPTPRTDLGFRLTAADLALRPATLDDAAFVADLYTAAEPDDPEDPVLLRHSWSVDETDNVVERFVALRDGRPVGFAMHRHAPWEKMPERFSRVRAELLPDVRTADRLAALFAAMEERSRADGARHLTAWAWEHDTRGRDALAGLGYREERRERFWELDLARNRGRLEAMAASSRERMREQSIRILTLDRDDDPDRYRKIWRMSEEASADVPQSVPHVPQSFDQFRLWLASPGLREDRVWIARQGEDVVGISMLSYPPVRGVVSTDWTGTAREARGKGVARALKCESVLQAITVGIDRVRTDNDHLNAPILHLNESMGYARLPDRVMFVKAA